MVNEITFEEIARADLQVAQYKEKYPDYEKYSEILKSLLESAVEKNAADYIVQVRPKSITSFAGKIWRKREETQDPVNQFTDLCGARVIANNRDGVKTICEYIKSHFDIDWKNSVTIEQRLKPSEFGYRSVHYIVRLKKGDASLTRVKTPIPDIIFDLKAEIQVRTLLEHSWADFSHSIAYKQSFRMPDDWQREMAKLAAFLEESDSQLIRVKNGLKPYMKSYGMYLTPAQIEQEIKILENVKNHDPENIGIAREIVHLAFEKGDWQKVIDVLEPFQKTMIHPVVRDYAIAVCNRYSDDKKSREYQNGQNILLSVVEEHPTDIHALCSLAGSYRDIDEFEAEKYYRLAFERAPGDPYPLSYYLDYLVTAKRDPELISSLVPLIRHAYKRSRNLADVDLESPWTYFNMGKFSLLLDDKSDALHNYAKAIHASNSPYPLSLALRYMKIFRPVQSKIKGYVPVCSLLLLGMKVKFSSAIPFDLPACVAPPGTPLHPPVVIIAGGSESLSEKTKNEIRKFLIYGFQDFSGTVISGGTLSGVAELVGDIQDTYKEKVRSIGYIPKPFIEHRGIDRRYSEFRTTDGESFSFLEAIQYWTDIIASGIAPRDVKLIGVGGGPISATEYRIAAGLGARVGIISDTGGEADKLFLDNDWNTVNNVMQLPADAESIRAFISMGIPALDPADREILAHHIHDEYQRMQLKNLKKDEKNSSMRDWADLSEEFRNSNRAQADHTRTKLNKIGYTLTKVNDRDIVVAKFSRGEVEVLAEMEHGRWNVERLLAGWRYGPKKDVDRKISPYLLQWNQLSEPVKEWDRNTIRELPAMLAKVGYEVAKK
jgi:ppGpp synthetase/RelA/SpoT-type nucleotidyltranferase